MFLRSNKGFLSPRMIVILLALVGIWTLWHAYQNGTLRQSCQAIFSDYSQAAKSAVGASGGAGDATSKIKQLLPSSGGGFYGGR